MINFRGRLKGRRRMVVMERRKEGRRKIEMKAAGEEILILIRRQANRSIISLNKKEQLKL